MNKIVYERNTGFPKGGRGTRAGKKKTAKRPGASSTRAGGGGG